MRLETLYKIIQDLLKTSLQDAPIYNMDGEELEVVDFVKSHTQTNSNETIIFKFYSIKGDENTKENTDEKKFEAALQEAWEENLVHPINRPPDVIGEEYMRRSSDERK